MMKKMFFTALVCITGFTAKSQIEVSKLIGKNSDQFGTGFGAFLKFAYPVSEADDATLEVSGTFFFEKNSTRYGVATFPLKLGYRYSFNRTGRGFYAEPQLGYNLYGVRSYYAGKEINETFHGVLLGAGTGYVFQPLGGVNFDLGLRFESLLYNGGSLNSVSLRLAHYFTIGKKRD